MLINKSAFVYVCMEHDLETTWPRSLWSKKNTYKSKALGMVCSYL